jgi:hypothetical protein
MALSACRLALIARSSQADEVSRRYQTIALCGIQQAVTELSTNNVDAILAASILLSAEVDGW